MGVVIALLGMAAVKPDLLGAELTPVAATYWVLLNVYLGLALATSAVVFWTIGTDVPPGMPRTALRAIAGGAGVLAVDSFFRSGVMVALGRGMTLDLAALDPPATAVQATGVLLMVGGGAVAAPPRTRAVLRAYRSLLILRPLWRAMRDAFPEVILFTPRWSVVALAGADEVHLRVYRRVIEIRDGMLALRAYLPPDSSPSTSTSHSHFSGETDLSDFSDPAVVEAEAIVAALERRACGAEPFAVTGSWAPVGPETDDEVAWLSRVSAAYRRVTRTGARIPRPSGSAR
jgi:hypothetical protein